MVVWFISIIYIISFYQSDTKHVFYDFNFALSAIFATELLLYTNLQVILNNTRIGIWIGRLIYNVATIYVNSDLKNTITMAFTFLTFEFK